MKIPVYKKGSNQSKDKIAEKKSEIKKSRLIKRSRQSQNTIEQTQLYQQDDQNSVDIQKYQIILKKTQKDIQNNTQQPSDNCFEDNSQNGSQTATKKSFDHQDPWLINLIHKLQTNFYQWFQTQINNLHPEIEKSQVQNLQNSLIRSLYEKIIQKNLNCQNKSSILIIDKVSPVKIQLEKPTIKVQIPQKQFSQKQPNNNQNQSDNLNQIAVQNIIKQNIDLINRQIKWQNSDQCPPHQKLSYQRKKYEVVDSFIKEGYGMASLKKFIIKKFLNQQKQAQILLPLIKSHEFYKRQTRPIIKYVFTQLQYYLKSKQDFPKSTNGYVEIKNQQIKWYITPLLHCRGEFQPQICSLFFRLMAHVFHIQKPSEQDKREIGLTLKQAQLLYTKIISKFYQKKMDSCQTSTQNQKSAFDQKISLQKNESFHQNSKFVGYNYEKQKDESKNVNFLMIKQKLQLKDQMQNFFIDQYLRGRNLKQITLVLSITFKQTFTLQEVLFLLRDCVKKSVKYTIDLQQKFMRSPLYFKDFLAHYPQPNENLLVRKFIKDNQSIEMLTQSEQFQELRKKIFIIYMNKIRDFEDIIQVWFLIERALKNEKIDYQKRQAFQQLYNSLRQEQNTFEYFPRIDQRQASLSRVDPLIRHMNQTKNSELYNTNSNRLLQQEKMYSDYDLQTHLKKLVRQKRFSQFDRNQTEANHKRLIFERNEQQFLNQHQNCHKSLHKSYNNLFSNRKNPIQGIQRPQNIKSFVHRPMPQLYREPNYPQQSQFYQHSRKNILYPHQNHSYSIKPKFYND